jgi:hypothetical protein
MHTIHVIEPGEVEGFCRDAIRRGGYFARADIPERWPLSREEVLSLLRDGGRLPCSDRDVTSFADAGVFTPPTDGKYFAVHVCELAYCVHRVLEHYGVGQADADAIPKGQDAQAHEA